MSTARCRVLWESLVVTRCSVLLRTGTLLGSLGSVLGVTSEKEFSMSKESNFRCDGHLWVIYVWLNHDDNILNAERNLILFFTLFHALNFISDTFSLLFLNSSRYLQAPNDTKVSTETIKTSSIYAHHSSSFHCRSMSKNSGFKRKLSSTGVREDSAFLSPVVPIHHTLEATLQFS